MIFVNRTARRIARFSRSIPRSLLLVAMLLVIALDGRIRSALGLLRSDLQGAIWIHRWCRRIVHAIGIQYTVDGDLPGRAAAAHTGFEAVVCNHLSYLDILLMSAARPFVCVAKQEVRDWPLLGWLTSLAGTVYVQRGAPPSTYPAVNAAMARAFRSGLPVLFFPEGTTTDGSQILPFRRGLFHSVLHDRVAVQTAALRYELAPFPNGYRPKKNGHSERSEESPHFARTTTVCPIMRTAQSCNESEATVADNVCWWGDALLAPHLFRLLGLRGLRAAVRFGDPVEGADRFILSQNAHAAVSTLYDSLAPASRANTGFVLTEVDVSDQPTNLIEAQ